VLKSIPKNPGKVQGIQEIPSVNQSSRIIKNPKKSVKKHPKESGKNPRNPKC